MEIVYNKGNLDAISDLCVFSAIINCDYLEDIESILERGLLNMDKENKEKFISDIKRASKDKDVKEAIKLEESLDDRFNYIAAMERSEGIKQGIEQGAHQSTIKIVSTMLKNNISPEDISNMTNIAINKVKEIEKEIHEN